MKKKTLISLVLVFGITSCGLWGPNYVKPKIAYLDKWRSKDNLAV